MRRLRFALILLTCLLLGEWDAFAYKQISTPNGSGVKWTSMPVGWSYNHNGFNQLSAQQMVQVLQASFAKWEAPTCSGLRFSYQGVTTSQWSQQDRKNVLIWNANIPDPNFPNALALTLPAYLNATGEYLDADIIFNGSFAWSLQPTGQQYDVIGTATHEIGHLLGLDHTQAQGATMFPTASPGLCPCRSLKQDDVNGVCAIYPASSSNTGSRQYGQACDAQNLCASGLVCVLLQTGATQGVCFRTCTQGTCPSGNTCYNLSNGQNACLCTKASDCAQGLTCTQNQCQQGGGGNPTKSQKLGEACNAQTLCVTGLTCVVTQQGSASGTCHRTCPNGTCSDGNKCYKLSNGEQACLCLSSQDCSGGAQCQGNFCRGSNSGGPAGKEGEACVGGKCEQGLSCLQDPNTTQSLCVRACQSNSDCVNQWTCNTQYNVCVPGSGSKQRGEACDNQNRCGQGLVCTLVQQGANQGVCILACPSGTCPTGEQCLKVQTGQQLCLCGPKNPCAAGKTCKELRCQDGGGGNNCTKDADCPQSQICQSGKCVPGCQSNNDCSAGEVCRSGQCQKGNGCQGNSDCAQGETCQGGTCVPSNTGGCQSSAECPQGQICQGGRCVNDSPGRCQSNTECAQGKLCVNGTCVNDGNSSNCNPPCSDGSVCNNGVCIFAKPCNTSIECEINELCQSGFCRPKKENPDRVTPPPEDVACSCQSASQALPTMLWLLILLPLLGRRRRA